MGAKFQTYLKRKGIHHEVTNAGTPQENGVIMLASKILAK